MLAKHTGFNALELAGVSTTVGAETVTVILRDSSQKILLATGTTVPTNDTAGYAKGALFIDTDVAKGTGSLYVNKGTTAECKFTLVTQA